MISLFFEKRAIENPEIPLSDPRVVDEIFGVQRSDTGIQVTAGNSLTYSPLFRAVTLLAGYAAKLPLVLYRRLEGDDRERAVDHPAYRLLRRKMNATMTAFRVKFTLTAQAILRGNGYALIDRNRAGEPTDILPLNSGTTSPINLNGRLFYKTRVGSVEMTFPAADILHIMLWGEGNEGWSLIDKARESIGLGLALRKHGSLYFKNAARPSVAIEHPESMSDGAARHLKESVEAIYGGLDNHHKVLLLEEGAKLNPFSVNPEDAQLLQTRQFEVREISNWTGIPPHKLGDDTRTSFNSVEQENQSFLDDALDPWLCAWESEVDDKILREKEKLEDSHFVEFLRRAILRANMKDRFESYATGISWGFITRDEARHAENLNSLPDGQGKRPLIPLNMVPVDEGGPTQPNQSGSSPNNQASEEERARVHSGLRRLALDIYSRMTKRVCGQAKKAARQPARFLDWVEESMPVDNQSKFEEVISPLADVLRADLAAIRKEFFEALQSQFFDASECKEDELQESIGMLCDRLEHGAAIEFVDKLMENITNENGKTLSHS